MIHDLLGERGEATRSYQMALAVKTDGMARDVARQYLDEPYRKEMASRTLRNAGDAKGSRSQP
jgi:hypothetical protein